MLWKAKSKQVPSEQKAAQSQPGGNAEYRETGEPSPLPVKAPALIRSSPGVGPEMPSVGQKPVTMSKNKRKLPLSVLSQRRLVNCSTGETLFAITWSLTTQLQGVCVLSCLCFKLRFVF